MIDILSALSSSPLTSGAALVAVLVWLIQAVATGKMIPAQTHALVIEGYQRENERLAGALERSQAQVDKLTSQGETGIHLMRSLTSAAEEVTR